MVCSFSYLDTACYTTIEECTTPITESIIEQRLLYNSYKSRNHSYKISPTKRERDEPSIATLIKTGENYLRLENNENCFGLENNAIHLRVDNFDTMIHYSIQKFKLYGDIAAWEDPHDESGDIIYRYATCQWIIPRE